MKIYYLPLLLLFGVMQYELWFTHGGLLDVIKLKHQIFVQETINKQIQQNNADLLSTIQSLQKGGDAVEQYARDDLGMIKKGEIFYQVIP